jgi:hypothetical protein
MPIFLQDYIDWLRFMIPFWGRDWAEAFLFTQAFEMPVYLVALSRHRPELRWYTKLAVAFGASAITHPFVWFLFPYFSLGHEPAYYWNVIIPAAESFAVVVEALYLWRLRVTVALGWAFFANGLSFGFGLLSRDVLGWW